MRVINLFSIEELELLHHCLYAGVNFPAPYDPAKPELQEKIRAIINSLQEVSYDSGRTKKVLEESIPFKHCQTLGE